MGFLLFLVGAAGAAAAISASFEKGRGLATLAGLLAPLAVLVALLGALLVFVPGFLG